MPVIIKGIGVERRGRILLSAVALCQFSPQPPSGQVPLHTPYIFPCFSFTCPLSLHRLLYPMASCHFASLLTLPATCFLWSPLSCLSFRPLKQRIISFTQNKKGSLSPCLHLLNRLLIVSATSQDVAP